MNKPRIVIVEDENIVAKDLQNTLTNLGYETSAIFATAEDALRAAPNLKPDLVLMDIMLTKGFIDGVEAAQRLKVDLDIPVIFITAYSDEGTLGRAKVTEAYGYILKPFNVRELHIAIEMALYRHASERQLRSGARWLSTTLNSIGDAVVATDATGKVIFVNPAAEHLVGWTESEALSMDVQDVFRVAVNGEESSPHPVSETLARGEKVVREKEISLISRQTNAIPVVCTASPIADEKGHVLGVVTVFRDVGAMSRERLELTTKIKSIESQKRMLERYFPEHLVDYLVDQEHVADLAGKNVQATMLFCDIRGSTAIAEDLMPGRFAQFLSDFYEGIMDLTYANGGSVNKFLGDGLLITFGCPIPEESDAVNCVRLALQIRQYVKAYNSNRPGFLRKSVGLGIGISSGLVFAGNVGSSRHMDYTVLGDPVNTASRLESLTKETGHDVLMDEATASRVRQDIELEAVGPRHLRGKKEAIAVFHPVALK